MTLLEQLENNIVDQVQKLNDDSIMSDPEQVKNLIDRSKSMSELTNSFIEIQKTKLEAERVKIEAVKVASNQGFGLKYEKYLGIELDKK